MEKNISIVREVIQTIQDIIYNHDLPNTKENEEQEYFCARCSCSSCGGNVIIPAEMYDFFKDRELKIPCPGCWGNGLNKIEEMPVDDRFYYQLFWRYNEGIAKHLDTAFEKED